MPVRLLKASNMADTVSLLRSLSVEINEYDVSEEPRVKNENSPFGTKTVAPAPAPEKAAPAPAEEPVKKVVKPVVKHAPKEEDDLDDLFAMLKRK